VPSKLNAALQVDLKADSFTQSVDLRVDPAFGGRQWSRFTRPGLPSSTAGLRTAGLRVARRARGSLWPPTLRKGREPPPPR